MFTLILLVYQLIKNLQVMLKKIKFKYSKKLISNSLTYKLSMVIDLTLSFFSLIMVFLYVIGNYQDFQDQSQQLILEVLSYVAIFNTIFSIFLFIESIFKLILENRKIKTIINMIFLLITVFFEMFCLEISTVISYLSKGLTG